MANLRDPLADLKAEIAAEEASGRQSGADDPPQTEPEDKASDEAPEEQVAESAAGDEVDKDAGKKPDRKSDVVPRSRFNEEAAKRRTLQNQLDELTKEVEALKNPPKAEDAGKPKPLTIEDIRAQERANVRLEMQLEDFVTTGVKEYTQEKFDESCNRISDVIGKDRPNNLIAIAIEAAGTPALAAKAIYLLGQQDVPEIEQFLAMSAIRQAAQLAKLATTRGRKADEDAKRGKTQIEEQEEPPAPIRPIRTNSRVMEGLGDDVPEDVWYERFEKQIMNKGQRPN